MPVFYTRFGIVSVYGCMANRLHHLRDFADANDFHVVVGVDDTMATANSLHNFGVAKSSGRVSWQSIVAPSLCAKTRSRAYKF